MVLVGSNTDSIKAGRGQKLPKVPQGRQKGSVCALLAVAIQCVMQRELLLSSTKHQCCKEMWCFIRYTPMVVWRESRARLGDWAPPGSVSDIQLTAHTVLTCSLYITRHITHSCVSVDWDTIFQSARRCCLLLKNCTVCKLLWKLWNAKIASTGKYISYLIVICSRGLLPICGLRNVPGRTKYTWSEPSYLILIPAQQGYKMFSWTYMSSTESLME